MNNKHDELQFTTLFHRDAEKRLSFLPELYKSGYKQEACTLCLCYIDSFAQLLCWPKKTDGRNFVAATSSFGSDSTLGLVHPLQAIREFGRMKTYWTDLANHMESLFPGPNYELLTESEFLIKLQPWLSSKSINQKNVLNEIWQTKIASIVYHYFRNPAVHNFGCGPDLSFDKTSYQGIAVQGVGFERLCTIATNLHAELLRRSEMTGQFCGNNEILYS
jgi:hypothetical protein